MVTVIDVRKVFNRVDYQIMPIYGQGLMWLEASRVTLDDAAETF